MPESIRAIGRGLAVLKAINQQGSLTMMEICRAAEVPYPTAYRIVQTLEEEGMIEREHSRKRYRPTALTQTLSSGFQDEDGLVAAGREPIRALCKEILWPVSVASRVGHHMMVRDSTFAMTSLTFTNYHAGYTLPLMECASGKAYLAYCSQEERQRIVAGLKMLDGRAEKMAQILLSSDALLEDIRSKGYASQVRNLYNATPGKTSSIAVPVLVGSEVAGVLVVIFFSVAMSIGEAAAKFLPNMQHTADAMNERIAAQTDRPVKA